MEQTIAFLPSMRPEHQKVAASPIQRNLPVPQCLARSLRVTALGLSNPDTSPFLHGVPTSGPIPVTRLWPKARKRTQKESFILTSDPVAVWPTAPPVPWEDPAIIKQG